MTDYTSLTVYTNFYYDITYEFKVKRTCFRPIPKVDSAIIKLTPKATLLDVDEELFFTIVRTAFWARRKTLLNTLLKGPYLECDPTIKEIDFFQKDSEIRGEVLGIEEYFELYNQIKPKINYKK
jgi:16S rRNA (adenine1518-N6/adenine1519-N6)-dimethyltransferase